MHTTCFVFLTIPGANSQVQITLPGWPRYTGDRLLCKAVNVLPLSPLSCLTCLGMGESLTFQDKFVVTEIVDSKDGLGKCLKKNNQEISPLSEVISIHFLYDISCVYFKVVNKLNVWCLVVISSGFMRRGEISVIGKTLGQLLLSAGTGQNALGKPKGPA